MSSQNETVDIKSHLTWLAKILAVHRNTHDHTPIKKLGAHRFSTVYYKCPFYFWGILNLQACQHFLSQSNILFVLTIKSDRKLFQSSYQKASTNKCVAKFVIMCAENTKIFVETFLLRLEPVQLCYFFQRRWACCGQYPRTFHTTATRYWNNWMCSATMQRSATSQCVLKMSTSNCTNVYWLHPVLNCKGCYSIWDLNAETSWRWKTFHWMASDVLSSTYTQGC